MKIQDITWNIFLRCQLSYFALANIPFDIYDSFLRIFLFLLGDTNINPGPTTVNNNKTPLNIVPFYNWDERTMSSKCDRFDCYKEHHSSKWKISKNKGFFILHLNINSQLTKTDKICFIGKQSNASVIGISELKFILNSEVDIEDYGLIKKKHSRR